jgi:protoheme IX farnesyltransferase
MLPVNDPGGASTARQSVAYAAALVPVTLLAGAVTAAGERYLWGAVALGALFVGCTIAFAFARSIQTARLVFLVSVLYLPAVLGLMVLDR